jgi:hypothetical protein
LKRRSNTKKPHDPHELFLDEGVSGKKFQSLLKQARLTVHLFESLLHKKKKVPDSRVIEVTARAGYVLITTDKRMEAVWTDDIISHKAKVILLTDQDGGPIHWASALIVGRSAWERVLLDHLKEPVTIKLNKFGSVTKIAGEEELRKRHDELLTVRITQAKKTGRAVKAGAIEEAK